MNNLHAKLKKASFGERIRVLEKELMPGIEAAYLRHNGQHIILLSSHLTAPQANVALAKALGHLACSSSNHLDASFDIIQQESRSADVWAYEFLLSPDTLADALHALPPDASPDMLAHALCVPLPFLKAAISHLRTCHGDSIQTGHSILCLHPNLQVKRRPPGENTGPHAVP